MNTIDPAQLDWTKGNGLLPAIVQHAVDGRVLMLAYMNQDALQRTLGDGRATFFSRSRQQLWMKGETSGHVLRVAHVGFDCDRDAILVLAHPEGPTCHNGTPTCFDDSPAPEAARIAFLSTLQKTIAQRITDSPTESYTAKLVASGIGRVAQKVGEEGVETALAAVSRDDPALIGECADLLYHLVVLLQARKLTLEQVVDELAARSA